MRIRAAVLESMGARPPDATSLPLVMRAVEPSVPARRCRRETSARYADPYRRGRPPVDRLMGEVYVLDEINTGLDRLASGSAQRDAVLFD